jgi:hypothetical protein
MCSCNKQQQAMKTLPIATDAIIAITDCNGRDQRLHHEVPKRSQDKLPQIQRERLWQSALKPQGGLTNKHNKGVMRAL